jgi:RHS repeat-associated protein
MAVEYYHTDALGSVRAVTKQVAGQWQVVSRHDFLPFGEEVQPPTPPPDKRLFTGQERDQETGLDYFKARYLRAAMGRFTTVDPVLNVGISTQHPQFWNRYAYALNNPLRFIDSTGRWPAAIHDVIFAFAFPLLARGDLAQIQAGSRWVDNERQDPRWSYAHGMRDGTTGQTVMQAMDLYFDWIDSYLYRAAEDNSLWQFGAAMHAVTDSFARSHRGFQAWSGYSAFLESSVHSVLERDLTLISGSEQMAMRDELWFWFYQTFAFAAFERATGYLYSSAVDRSYTAGLMPSLPSITVGGR